MSYCIGLEPFVAAAQAQQLEKLARERGAGQEQREQELASLQDTFRAHVAESSARITEGSEREDRLVAANAQSRKELTDAMWAPLLRLILCL